MNNRSNNNNDATDKRLKSQQMFQGFPGRNPNMGDQQQNAPQGFMPGPPPRNVPPGAPSRNVPPGAPPGAPGMGAPGMGEPPRTAPPSFTPEGPGMEQRQMGRPGEEPGQFGYGGQRREEFRVRPRDLQRCLNRFTFIWLFNGNSFWFYPTFVDRQFLFGFRWRRNRWEYDRININRIIFFRCF